MQPLLRLVDANKTLASFFERIFGVCSKLLQDKNVYELNLATVLVISTFDISSLFCFTFFVGGLSSIVVALFFLLLQSYF